MSEFYVGYQPNAPRATGRFARRTVQALLGLSVALAAALAASMGPFAASRFEFGAVRRYEGELVRLPYPVLVTTQGSYILVGQGKHGASIDARDGDRIALMGTLAEREGMRLLQVEGNTRALPGKVRDESVRDFGQFTLNGEVVDTKCYLGVMNPGQGKVHRQCAAACLRGGIPPGLYVRDAEGAGRVVLLAGQGGRLIGADLAGIAGETVSVSGRLLRRAGALVLEIDPRGVHRRE